MENLLQRLKPDLKALIEQDLVNYPFLVNELIKELTDKYYMNDVKYMHIIDLEGYYLKLHGKQLAHAWDCLIY